MSPKRFLMAFPRRVRAENATFVVESIKALGLPVPAGSRVMQMYRTLTDESRPMIRPTDPDFETAVEAERDLQVLAFVFDVAAAHPTDQKFRDLIRFALGDSVLPQDNRGNSRGRDFQFELFIAAICQNAGLTPIEREEPDVTCVVEGVNYGIAAKRIKGVGNLQKRISKAANADRESRLARHNSFGDYPPLQSQQYPHNQANVRQRLRKTSPPGPLSLYRQIRRPNPRMGAR